jgi:hypothetical protein
MTEEPGAASTSVTAHETHRGRAVLAGAGRSARQVVDRLRGRKPSVAAGAPGPAGPAAPDDTGGSPTDLAEADASVQRAWARARMVIAVVVTVVPIVAALVSWRIRVSRARRGGLPIDL